MSRLRERPEKGQEFNSWLDHQLAALADEESSRDESPHGPSVAEFTADVLRRVRVAKPAGRKHSSPRRSALRTLAWSAGAVVLAFTCGVIWQLVGSVDAPTSVSREAQRVSRPAAAPERVLGTNGGVQVVQASGDEEDYARLATELGSLGRQLEQLRRLRDAAGPTVELTAQDGLRVVIPLDEVLDLAETPAGNAALRRVRW